MSRWFHGRLISICPNGNQPLVGRSFLSALLVLIAINSVVAQVDTVWSRVYDPNPPNDRYGKTIRTQDGGFAIGGTATIPDGDSYENFILIKVDSTGEQEWFQTYRINWLNRMSGVAQTSDHGYVMCGLIDSTRSTGWLVKVDSTGEMEWANPYGESAIGLWDLIIGQDGNIVATGDDRGHFSLIKVDNNGDLIWEQHYGGIVPLRVIATRDGGYMMAGWGVFENGNQAFAVKVDSTGEEEWHQDYGNESIDAFYSVVQLPSAGFLFAGKSEIDRNDSYTDSYAVETDSLGEVIWERTYYRYGSDYFWDVVIAPQNGYLFLGDKSDGPIHKDYVAKRVDLHGEVLWDLDIGRQRNGIFKGGLVLEDGGYILAGEREPLDALGRGYWLVRTTPDTTRVNSVQLLDPAFPSQFIVGVPYPNPFNSTLTIQYSTGFQTCPTQLVVYDLSGRLVADLTDRNVYPPHSKIQNPNSKIVWNASAQPAGVYFVRLQSGSESTTKKVVLLR